MAQVVSAIVGNSRNFSGTEYAAAALVCVGTAGAREPQQ